jgi:hypothetical protein
MANLNISASVYYFFTANTTTSAISDGITRDAYRVHAIQSTGAGAGNTFDIEGSLDGATWVKIGSTLAADTITQITGVYRYIRAKRQTGNDPLTVLILSADRLRR